MRASRLNPAEHLPWTDDERLLLGTREDRELALLLGRSPNAVSQQRQKMGIPSYRQQMNCWSKSAKPWTEEDLALLGTMPDRELAQKTDRTIDSICKQRRKLGIKMERFYWSEKDLALLGMKPDKEVGELVGRTTVAVTDKRKKMGVLSYQFCTELNLPLGTTRRQLKGLLAEAMKAELSHKAS